VGQDGGSYGVDLPDEASDLFLAATLDGENHIEITEEISVGAQAPFASIETRDRRNSLPSLPATSA
jgi:hypothetical protein